MKKSEYFVAITVMACSLIMAFLFSFAIGDFEWGTRQRILKVLFIRVNSIQVNTTVKFAGAPIGRVSNIRTLSLEERRELPPDFQNNIIELTCLIDPSIELTDDVIITFRQDNLLAPKFVALIPGNDMNAAPLPENAILIGEQPVDFADLAIPGKKLLDDLLPVAEHLKDLTEKLDETIPNMIGNLDVLLENSDQLISSINIPDNRKHIRKTLANLSVVTANMKVVTSNAKALTLTLAETPWRLIWGGKTNPPIPEKEVLKSNNPIPIPNLIEVNAPSTPLHRSSRPTPQERAQGNMPRKTMR